MATGSSISQPATEGHVSMGNIHSIFPPQPQTLFLFFPCLCASLAIARRGQGKMPQLAAAGEGKERTQQNGRANKIMEGNLGRKEAMK